MCSKEWFIFLYFRSQKTAHFQKQSGLNAQLSGMSLTGLAAGQIIGFSTNPTTILNYKNDLAKGHPSYVCEQLSKSLEVWQFFNLLLFNNHTQNSIEMSFQQYKLCVITQSCSGFLFYELVHPSCFPVNQSTFCRWWSCNEGPNVLI